MSLIKRGELIMMSKKTIKIISAIIAIVLVLAMIVPSIVYALT